MDEPQAHELLVTYRLPVFVPYYRFEWKLKHVERVWRQINFYPLVLILIYPDRDNAVFIWRSIAELTVIIITPRPKAAVCFCGNCITSRPCATIRAVYGCCITCRNRRNRVHNFYGRESVFHCAVSKLAVIIPPPSPQTVICFCGHYMI